MKVTDSIFNIGVNDHNIDLFEGQYHVPDGISYNSYIIFDDKIAVIDSVDVSFSEEWLENMANTLNGRRPDYLIVLHMEPDHSASMLNFLKHYPDTTIISNKKSFEMMEAFYELSSLCTKPFKKIEISNGDSISLGKHCLNFLFAPMVHWPEVMVMYESTEKILFSADAFGRFGAINTTSSLTWDDEARRYYIGIVGKYGTQVQTLLKKAASLEINTICSLHGPVLTDNLAHYINLYDTWSSYRPESEGVLIVYASVYGNTKDAAMLLSTHIHNYGKDDVEVLDLARCDMHDAIAKAFKYSHLVICSLTYNADVFPCIKTFLNGLVERNYSNRTVGLIENGSWAPLAAKKIKESLADCKNITFCDTVVSIRSSVKSTDADDIRQLAKELVE